MGDYSHNWKRPHTQEELGQFLKFFERANQVATINQPRKLRQAALELILESCGAVAGVLFVQHSFSQDLVPSQGKGYADLNPASLPQLEKTQTLIAETLQRGHPIAISDLSPESGWLKGLETYALKGTRSILSVPMFLNEKLFGLFLAINFQQVSPALQQLLANHLAAAIKNSIDHDDQTMRINRLNALVAVLGQLGANLDREKILSMVINYAPVLLNAEASSLFLIDEETNELVLQQASNNQNLRPGEIRVPPGKGIIGTVVETGQTIIVNDVKKDERHYSEADQSTGFQTRSILAVPLTTRMIALGSERGSTSIHTVGGLEVLNKLDGPFTEEDGQLFRSLAHQAATVLQIANLYDDANKLLEGVLEALAAAIDAKDPYTEGHSRRVRDFSLAIAEELGYLDKVGDINNRREVWVGSLLHDIGKIGIPDQILSKDGRLTPEEYLAIKQHPIIGRHILEQVPQLRGGLSAIAQHHEHLDGSGYPDQLREEQITLTARIVAVADVFDAMTSNRPYRDALPVEEVFEYMKEVSGKHLDGDCVNALIQAYQSGKVQTQRMREVAQTRPLRNPLR